MNDLPAAHRFVRFEIFIDYEKKYRWRLWNENDELLADSAKSFESFEAAREAAEQARAKAQLASIEGE